MTIDSSLTLCAVRKNENALFTRIAAPELVCVPPTGHTYLSALLCSLSLSGSVLSSCSSAQTERLHTSLWSELLRTGPIGSLCNYDYE